MDTTKVAQVYLFLIEGEVVPHPRMTHRSKFVGKQALRYLRWKEVFGWLVKQQMLERELEILDRPISIGIIFWRKRARGDLKNLIESVEDALNGIVWVDDAQIRSYLCALVIKSEVDRTLLFVV